MDSLLESLQTLPMSFFLIIISSLCFLGLISRLRWRSPYPPGPKGFPLIGNMHMMDQLTHRGLAKLARQYGGLFHMRMGFLHMVAVSSPEVARQVLQVQDNIFSNRPANVAISYLTYDRADMAFAHYGPFWRQMRKLCVMKLFSRKRAESWDSVRDEVDSMVKTVGANTGKPVNVGELIFTLTMNITYRAAFGAKRMKDRMSSSRFCRSSPSCLEHSTFRISFLGLAGLTHKGSPLDLSRLGNALDKFIDHIIDDHIQKRNQNNHSEVAETDMVDDMLTFYSEETKVNESDDLQNAIKLTRENIKAIIMDVMFGGTETVASAIEWAMAELLKSPEDLKTVQQELADVVGLERRVEESDFDKAHVL
ncbi:hypothetical protein OIU78_020566 [Salix suchowensis]|nr:hypothetical protein OIU78_020566 [Salix suchowensis]